MGPGVAMAMLGFRSIEVHIHKMMLRNAMGIQKRYKLFFEKKHGKLHGKYEMKLQIQFSLSSDITSYSHMSP